MTGRRLTVSLAAVAIALGVATAVKASIPDGSGVIHGCYAKSAAPGSQPGTLRVIDTALGQACQLSESAVNWSQTGPQGPAGPQGAQGARGPTGPKGDKGDPGANAYFAGTGLNLSGGNTFNISGSYQLPQGCSSGQSPFLLGTPLTHPWSCFTAANANESCASGKFQDGVDASGDITCATPSGGGSTLPDAWVYRHYADQDTPVGTDVTLGTLSLPAGSFVVEAQATANGDGSGDDVALNCWIEEGDALFVGTSFNVSVSDSLSLTDVVTLPAAGDVHLECDSAEPHTHASYVAMTATEVGTVH